MWQRFVCRLEHKFEKILAFLQKKDYHNDIKILEVLTMESAEQQQQQQQQKQPLKMMQRMQSILILFVFLLLRHVVLQYLASKCSNQPMLARLIYQALLPYLHFVLVD